MIKYCQFCGHWLNNSGEKCNNCGEFIHIKSKRLWFHVWPIWVSAFATALIAIASVIGALKVRDILNEARVKAIENHLSWIEVRPVNFSTRGEKDPKDISSTFWYLTIQVNNLGKEAAFVHIKDWSFKSSKRGIITKEDYKSGEKEFSLPSAGKAIWVISFVMNSDYHIPALISGEDVLTIAFKFDSKDMSGVEECLYEATWEYTKGRFLLIEDNRNYHNLNK